MTYSSLIADLQAYLERGQPTDTTVFDQLPRIINLAERAIARALKIQGFLVSVTAVLSAGVNVYPKPNRWRRTVSMNYGIGDAALSVLETEDGETILTEDGDDLLIELGSIPQNNRQFLLARSYEYCRSYWPNATKVGVPKFYADYDYLRWIVVPTPEISYPWEILYYELPVLLDNTVQTNWLTNFAPNALLYRSLLETTPFLKNDERLPTWKQFYDEEMSGLNVEDMSRSVDRTAVRNED